jgi:NADH:ubiquinone oxidoreductase subunit 5 (subunit L)/multisubunit Na+/H+ antiporter MnhA subunit
MKNTFLPNYFKLIGLAIFFISLIISYPDFIRGVEAGMRDAQIDQINPPTSSQAHYPTIYWSDALLVIGMLIYAFSREKLEDEYLQRQRSEAFFWAFNLMLGVILGLILLDYRSIDVWFFPTLQLISFLLIFYFKKRTTIETSNEE